MLTIFNFLHQPLHHLATRSDITLNLSWQGINDAALRSM